MVATGDFKISASGRKVRRLIKVGDDGYSKEKDIDNDGDNDENDEKAKKMRGESVELEQLDDVTWYDGSDMLGEAQERYSKSYQFTHKPGDEESEKKLSGLKKMVKGTGKRVVLMGRLGKDNPNAHKYKKGGEVSSNRSQFAGTHKYIKKGDAAHHDVYVYDRRESVEHIQEATVKSQNYSWGTMKTVHHGKDFSIPLHPEHHKPIAALKHGESHSFKDETGNKWKATREDDTVHFHGGSYGTQKTSVKHDTMKESVNEATSSGNAQHALANSEHNKHAAYMKKTHGVETKYHGTDELSYHGDKASVKKALINHYDNEEEAKALHPKVFKESYINEQHLVHVNDGSKYNEEPHDKDVEHVMSGAKTHKGEFDSHTDKGAVFKFKDRSDADNFKRHVDKCPKRTCSADHLNESTEQINEASDKQDSRLLQLARLGLLDKNDVAIFRNAMQTFKADKQLSIKQRNMLLSVYNDLVNMVTGDDAMFARAKLDVQKEEVQIDELSKGLVARYANKVAKTTQDNYDKSKDKFQFSSGREDGMKNAVKRLTKEESEQIDEISKGTLASYIKKSKDQAGLIAHDLGHRIGSSPDAGVTLKPSYVKDKGKYVQRSKGINRAAEKLAKEATEYKGIGTDVVDKKKVLNPPIPLTQKAKQVKDFKEGDEYDEKWKEYKGKSFKKESVMLKFNDFLEEAKKCTDEELVGKQHKIDKNKNGKIDADDFKKLRKEETESIEESYPTKQHFEQMAALIKSHDDEKKRSDLAHHHAGIFKGQNPRFDHKKFMHACGVHESAVCEEVEPIEELSKSTLASYVPKAARSARIHGQISSEYKSASDRARKSSMKDSLDRLSKKYKNKAWSREDGIKRAANKLAKEEVEQIDELSKGTLASYAKASTFDAAKQGNEIAKLGNNLSALSKVNGPMYKLNKRLAGHGKAVDKLAKEEVEQIDEISKNTLGSYVKKASSDIADRQERIRAGARPNPGESQADFQKDMTKALALQSKRKAGMDKAVDKLTKEEVEQEQSPYLKATLAVMDEGKIDNLRDAQALRKAGGSSYEKELKPDTKHPHIQVVKGTSYGGENQKDDEHDEKSDDGEKRGRGRPSGSKSGAR